VVAKTASIDARQQPRGKRNVFIGDYLISSDELPTRKDAGPLQIFAKVFEVLHGVVVICGARGEAHVEVETVRGNHGARHSVEIDGFSFGRGGSLEDSLGKSASEAGSARRGPDP
jgi:hypothetical protein